MGTMSSREFNQDTGRAKREAEVEPVFITDRGKPSHVLMSFRMFCDMTGGNETIVDILGERNEFEGTFDPEPVDLLGKRGAPPFDLLADTEPVKR